jgi:hypothetical protein
MQHSEELQEDLCGSILGVLRSTKVLPADLQDVAMVLRITCP